MNAIIKNSIFLKTLIYIVLKSTYFYKKSIFCYTICAIKRAYRSSKTKKALRRFVTRNAYFKYSVIYRIIYGISNVLTLFARFLNKMFIRAIRGSKNIRKFKAIKNTEPSLLCVYAGFFIGVFTLSYSSLTLMTGPIESINAPLVAILSGVAILCLLVGNIADYAKDSVLYKIIIYFFED